MKTAVTTIDDIKSWRSLSKYNDSQPAKQKLYLKSELSRIGLKPITDAHGVTLTLYSTQTGHREHELFTLNQTIPKVQKKEVKCPSITPDNLCESLYIINKSAKKSRDTVKEKYNEGKYGIVSSAKTRRTKLYDLKNSVMKRMIKDNILLLVGYHTQDVEYTYKEWHSSCENCEDSCSCPYDDCDEEEYNSYDENDLGRENCYKRNRWYETVSEINTNYLLLYQHGNYTFHAPVNTKPENVKFLGKIDIIPAVQTMKTTITYSQAVKLLKNYLGAV